MIMSIIIIIIISYEPYIKHKFKEAYILVSQWEQYYMLSGNK